MKSSHFWTRAGTSPSDDGRSIADPRVADPRAAVGVDVARISARDARGAGPVVAIERVAAVVVGRAELAVDSAHGRTAVTVRAADRATTLGVARAGRVVLDAARDRRRANVVRVAHAAAALRVVGARIAIVRTRRPDARDALRVLAGRPRSASEATPAAVVRVGRDVRAIAAAVVGRGAAAARRLRNDRTAHRSSGRKKENSTQPHRPVFHGPQDSTIHASRSSCIHPHATSPSTENFPM